MSCTVGFTKSCGANSQTLQRLLGQGDAADPHDKDQHESKDAQEETHGNESPLSHHHNYHRLGGARSDVFLTLGGVSGIQNEALLDAVRFSNLNFAKSHMFPTSQRAHRGKAIPAGAAVKAQKSTRPLVLFPPIFDTRLFYRAAHIPYEIHDQGSCASCVFISATTTAQVRAAIQLGKVNAATIWRAILREERDDEEQGSYIGSSTSATPPSTEAFRNAVQRFVEMMSQQAEWGGLATTTSNARGRVPALQWEQYICCETKEECTLTGKAAGACYHHKDEPSERAAFTCDVHGDGVVPHHFLEWIREGDRGFVDENQRRVIRTIRPEHKGMTPEFALIKSIEIKPEEELSESDTRRIAEQVRAIKTSLMSNGPVMAMIRIDGKTFDTWGRIKKPVDKDAKDKKGSSSRRSTIPTKQVRHGKRSADEGEDDEEDEDGDLEVEHDENTLAGQVRRRKAYRLPGRDTFDEYHEVMVVGWSYDDYGTPCWIIQNSYGPYHNSHCAISPWASQELDPWMAQLLDTVVRRGYEESGLMDKRGCVFVEMVNADLVLSGCTTDLENNVLSFIPVVDDTLKEGKQLVEVYSAHTGDPTVGASMDAQEMAAGQDVSGPMIWILGLMLVVVAVGAIWLSQPTSTHKATHHTFTSTSTSTPTYR